MKSFHIQRKNINRNLNVGCMEIIGKTLLISKYQWYQELLGVIELFRVQKECRICKQPVLWKELFTSISLDSKKYCSWNPIVSIQFTWESKLKMFPLAYSKTGCFATCRFYCIVTKNIRKGFLFRPSLGILS